MKNTIDNMIMNNEITDLTALLNDDYTPTKAEIDNDFNELLEQCLHTVENAGETVDSEVIELFF